MSWDIVLFNSKQKIKSISELDQAQLEPSDFSGILEKLIPTNKQEKKP